MNNTKQLLNKELAKIVTSLKEKYQPEKIFLFGSMVNGKIHKWSDLDLLVIKKTDKKFYDRIDEVSGLINHGVPIDILVYTPKEFKLMAKENYFIRDEILNSGKILYAS